MTHKVVVKLVVNMYFFYQRKLLFGPHLVLGISRLNICSMGSVPFLSKLKVTIYLLHKLDNLCYIAFEGFSYSYGEIEPRGSTSEAGNGAACFDVCLDFKE